MKLRDYQQQAINDIREAFRAGSRSVLLQLPTGGGKTVIFSEACRLATSKGNSVLILVHRRELVDQASDKLTRIGVDHGIICAGYKPRVSKVQVASVQTLARRLKLQPFTPQLIIIDEAHHCTKANTWGKVLNYWSKARLIGVTATPCRLDGKGLKHIFDTLITGPSVAELTAAGHLSPAKLWAPPARIDLSKLKTRAGDYVAEQAGEAMSDKTIIGDVVAHYKRHADGVPAIAFCCNVYHAEIVARDLRANGISARTLFGSTPKPARASTVQDFADGRVQVLVTVDVVSEGFDCPAAGAALLLRPTKSEALYLQQVGRVLRPWSGKSHAIVLDHVGNIRQHGFPDEEREWTLNDRLKRGSKGGPAAAAVRECPECFAAFKPSPVCPSCGHKFIRQEGGIQNLPGELQELRREEAQRRVRRREVGQARTLEQLLEVAKQRGYKPGWAYRMMESRKARRYG